MGFKVINDLDAENVTALGGFNKKTGKKNPVSAEGYYLGSREVDGKKGKAKLHFLQTPTGNLGVWGKTDMDKKLPAVPVGTMVRITHTGMLSTKNGEMYNFKVEVDDENTIEVLGVQAFDSGNANEASDEEYVADSEDEGEEEQEYTPPPAARPGLSAAERSAKVQALLGKKK
jgi:hypothetical protein